MKYFIFLFLIISFIITFFYFDKKIALLKKQLLVANNQNVSLRAKVCNYSFNKNCIEVKFLICANNTGLINNNSNIFIAPLINSPILNKSSVKMEVKLLDKVKIKNEYWYYISLPLDSNINSRGWVQESDFTSFYNSSGSIIKSSNYS